MADAEFIQHKEQMLSLFASGCKPKSNWRIGSEHEKILFNKQNHQRLEYHGDCSIKAMLEGMNQAGWEQKFEGENVIALENSSDKSSISLEPGGQFELSGAPLANLHQSTAELNGHLEHAKQVSEAMGAGMLTLGYDPHNSHQDAPKMPKGRYRIMRAYMPKKGKHGLDMMHNSTTVQVNLDYSDEADMIKKFRVSLALQPIATAIFANSPFALGTTNGYMSYRSYLWQDTDPDRTGSPEFIYQQGFSFESYLERVLDVPMYFVYRDGHYHDVSGLSFRDFLAGKLKGFTGQLPTIKDFDDHLTTVFFNVRMKKFLEMRSADAGTPEYLRALPAFWVGLLYDQEALDAAYDLIKTLSAERRQALTLEAPRLGFAADQGRLHDIARQAAEIALHGLKKRNINNAQGQDERCYLDAIMQGIQDARSPADALLERYHGVWKKDLSHVYQDCVF